MADDVQISAGSGTTIATDDISGRHFQYMKLADGTADSTNKAVVNSSGSLSVSVADATYSAKTVDASSSGDNTIHTPTSGLKVRTFYICLSASGSNTADVAATVKFGSTSIYKLNLKPG